MQHAILLMADHTFLKEDLATNDDMEQQFQNFEIYIGDSTDYQQNTKCAGGPFLTPESGASQNPMQSNRVEWGYGTE